MKKEEKEEKKNTINKSRDLQNNCELTRNRVWTTALPIERHSQQTLDTADRASRFCGVRESIPAQNSRRIFERSEALVKG